MKKNILFICSMVLFAGLLYLINIDANIQNEDFAVHELMYEETNRLHLADQSAESVKYLDILENRFDESFVVNNLIAAILVDLKDYEKAALNFKLSLHNNPYQAENPNFMLDLAQVYMNLNEFHNVKYILEYLQQLKDIKSYVFTQYHLETMEDLQEKLTQVDL